MQSQILQLPSGYVNNVNDALAGMSVAPPSGVSYYGGQVGKWADWDDATVKYDSSKTISTVYGGRFQYVQLASTAGSTIAAGSLVFWNSATAPGLYEVTDVETEGSSDAAIQIAGIMLTSSVTPGNFTLIQTVGLVYVQFCATLTSVGAKGSPVYAGGFGAGADHGLADVVNTANPALMSDVTLLQRRFLGTAYEAPTNGGLKRVYLGFTRYRE